MSVEDNKAIVRRFYDELNKGNIEGAEDCLASGFVRYTVTGNVTDKAGYRQFLRRIVKTVPDIHRTLNEMIAEGDKMAIWFTWTGTDAGGLGGGPPSGKPLVVPEVYITRFEGGKIVEFRQFADLLGLYGQMGKSPPAPQRQ